MGSKSVIVMKIWLYFITEMIGHCSLCKHACVLVYITILEYIVKKSESTHNINGSVVPIATLGLHQFPIICCFR